MTIDPARAAGHAEHNGVTYYFCGKGCLAKFTADPEKYLSAAREHVGTAKPQHLSTVAPKHPSTPTEYTCPMHPDVVRIGPGVCPICGMALEPRVADLSD